MKRIFLLFCAAVLALSSFSVAADSVLAEEENGELSSGVYVDANRLKIAEALLNAITNEPCFKAETVSRGEFVNMIANVMLLADGVAFEEIYGDVKEDNAYAEAITAAARLGWISPNENFNPNDDINFYEAVKIVVSAADYGKMAEASGGWPTGYLRQANKIKLLKGITQNGESLKPEQAKVMLFNLLLSNRLTPEIENDGFGGGVVNYSETGETILYALYGIYETEGVINETSYNSLLPNGEINLERKFISIDGKRFDYKNTDFSLLGKRVTAFVNEEKEEVVALEAESGNDIFVQKLYDMTFDGNQIRYTSENGKEKTLKWNGGISVYNGKTLESLTSDYFEKDGYAEFIDNNDDGVYDILHITAYRYVTVGSVDRINRRIGDTNSSDNNLDFSNTQDGAVMFFDADGDEISVYGISTGDVLCVVAPEDMSFGRVEINASKQSGEIEAISKDGIRINGEEYELSHYFKKYNTEVLTVGSSYSFYTGYDNRIICVLSSGDGYCYGFILKAAKESKMDEKIKLKIFDENGKMKILELSEKVVIDNVRQNSTTTAYSSISGLISSDDSNRMVRYKSNAKEKIVALDFPKDYSYADYEAQTAEEADKLLFYPEYKKSLRYRNNTQMFNGDTYIGKAKCFVIPDDLSDEEKFFFAGAASGVLTHDQTYTPYIYDIDEYGVAGAVVVRGKNEAVTGSDLNYVIEEVCDAIDSKNERMKLIRGWSKGKMYEFYMPDDVVVTKDSSSLLEPGDIIRVKTDKEGYIYKLWVDFDYKNFALNGSLASGNIRNKLSNFAYWAGEAYSLNTSYATLQLSAVKNEYGEGDFSAYNLDTLNANLKNIMCFDCQNKEVRPITYEEIKTYKEFKNECDFVVLRNNYDAPQTMVVYSNR